MPRAVTRVFAGAKAGTPVSPLISEMFSVAVLELMKHVMPTSSSLLIMLVKPIPAPLLLPLMGKFRVYMYICRFLLYILGGHFVRCV